MKLISNNIFVVQYWYHWNAIMFLIFFVDWNRCDLSNGNFWRHADQQNHETNKDCTHNIFLARNLTFFYQGYLAQVQYFVKKSEALQGEWNNELFLPDVNFSFANKHTRFALYEF